MNAERGLRVDAEPVLPGLPEFLQCCGAMAVTPARLLWPQHRNEQLLARIEDAGVPTASECVRLTVLTQSHRMAPTPIVAAGAWHPARLALGDRTFLVEHPKGRFLIDPSLDQSGGAYAMPQLPLPLRLATKVRGPVTGLADALSRIALRPEDIDFAIATHLHWDHVCGVVELPGDVPLVTAQAEYNWVAAGGGAGTSVPRAPFADRTFEPIELHGSPVLTFERSHDLFGDGSVVLVDMAGHTPGSMGVLLALEDGQRVLAAGDAVWHSRQARLLRAVAPFPGWLVHHDRRAAFNVVHRLHMLPHDVTLLPTHDRDACAPWVHPAFS